MRRTMTVWVITGPNGDALKIGLNKGLLEDQARGFSNLARNEKRPDNYAVVEASLNYETKPEQKG